MELEFKQQTIEYLQLSFSKTASQEQTQEMIVPDSYPDCARIVFTGASAIVRGRECRDANALVTGGVRASVLYVPEDGTQVRALACYIPYSIRADDPALTQKTQLCACVRVRAAEARLINSRKILVRVDLVCELAGYAQAQQTLCELQNPPDSLQLKTAQYRLSLPQEYAEKSFSTTQELELNGAEPEAETLVHYWLTPELTEQKLNGTKAVFKGNLNLKVLYLAQDGTPEVLLRQIPFSQYCELTQAYEDDALRLCVCLTGSELELSRAEGAPEKLLLSVSLLCQCVSLHTREVSLTQDAYTTRGDFSPQWQALELPCLLDRQTLSAPLRGSVPAEARAVVDSTLYLDAPTYRRVDAGLELRAPSTVNILYYDGAGALQAAVVRDEVCLQIPCGAGAVCEAAFLPGRDGFAAPSGGGMDVRYDVTFDIFCRCEQAMTTLCGGEITQDTDQTEKFCVVVRENQSAQPVWELAKQYRTKVDAILQANGLETDEVESGTLLLIPV